MEGAPDSAAGALFPYLRQEAIGMFIGLPGIGGCANVRDVFHEEVAPPQRHEWLGTLAQRPPGAARHLPDCWEAVR